MAAALPPSGIDSKLYQQLYAFEFIQIMTLSVFAWELITTLPWEIALYRKGYKHTLLLLSISRYFSLLCIILDVALNLAIGATPQFCHSIRWVLPFLSTMIQFASMPLLLLRAYAIWGKNSVVTAILVICWIGPLIIGVYVCTTYVGVPYSLLVGLDVVNGCGNDPTNDWGTAPFTVNMIVDSIVLILTLGRLSVRSVTRSSIRRLLIRDGILYYIVVVVVNVVNIVFFLAPGLPPLARPLIATPATVAPAIMVGRLFFNLQYTFFSPDGAPSSDPSHNSSNHNSSNRGQISLDRDTARFRDRNVFPLGPLKVAYSIDVKSDSTPATTVPDHPYSNIQVVQSQAGDKHSEMRDYP